MEPVIHSSLDAPDDLRCHQELDYSPYVAQGLGRVHKSIRRALATSRRFDAARRELWPLLSLPMCRHQRLRAYYLSGMVMARGSNYEAALQRLNIALDLAYELGDRRAITRIAHLLAGVHRNLCQFAREAGHQMLCLETLWELSPNGDPVDPALELGCLVDLAVAETMLADFERARWYLQDAEELARKVSGIAHDKALIHWMHGLLLRYQGDPRRALDQAMQACEVYAGSGSPAALARIQTVVADIALDVAESFLDAKPSMAHDAMLDLAERYLRPAGKNARAARDLAGEGLARLAQSRFDRLGRRNGDRLDMLESVFTTADALDDEGLRGQAFLTLGKELVTWGASADTEIRCYTKAVDALARTDLHAIELQAWRALLWAQEMRR